MEDEIKVLTLNTWGLLYVSKDVETRMKHIGDELSKGEFDIVALQEVWSLRHYDSIVDKVKAKLPYAHYFHSGVMGSGCAILSKYPIIDTFYHKFMHNGNFWEISHGDWFAGKGLACGIVAHPRKNIYVFNTHIHAVYPDAFHMECRTLQMYQLTQFVDKTTRCGDAIILCGDFNSQPDELGLMALIELGPVDDSYAVADEKPPNCYTCSCNIYQSSNEPKARLDYIFISDAFHCSECHLTMQQIPNTRQHYSDHEGYAVTLNFKQETETIAKNLNSVGTLKRIHDVILRGEQLSKEIAWRKLSFLFILMSLLIFLPVLSLEHFHSYVTTTQLDTWAGKFVFALQVVLVCACVVYTWLICIVRWIDVNSFKNIASEIELKIRHLESWSNKKKQL